MCWRAPGVYPERRSYNGTLMLTLERDDLPIPDKEGDVLAER